MILDRFRLDGKVAVISGGSRGIGAAIAAGFAEVGAKVVIASRTESELANTTERIRATGGDAEYVAADLSTRAGMEQLTAKAVESFDRIDIVVNNAGGTPPGPFLHTSEEKFNESLTWNLTTAFNLSQLAVPTMLESGGGVIINIASAVGAMRERGYISYGTAKAAMIAFAENLALDLSPKIRVNVIAPGSIRTDSLASILNDDIEKLMQSHTPLSRIGEVEDIAAAAVYLASDASSYVTGRVLQVDGGLRRMNFELGLPDL